MSAVLNQTKKDYKYALGIELILMILCLLLLLVVEQGNTFFSFILGSFASFLPHCCFVYWVFFRKFAKNTNKMTAFYRGEGIKWLTTIILIVASFKIYSALAIKWFFVGYFLFLLLNIIVPICVKLQYKKSVSS